MSNNSRERLLRAYAKANTSYSVPLRASGLRDWDVVAYSRYTKEDDHEAAQSLLDLGVDGRDIERTQRYWERGNIKPTRLEAALAYYTEMFGPSQALFRRERELLKGKSHSTKSKRYRR
ncbi:hypothetical protein HY025_01030 [Candidatus Daviesbacteria bacterium]|nr:hypothetical protein [Candidatus Daviesbacteria bacterium]